ncbi:MAG: hypothetical protein EHM18_06100 [Acidobacteria bacterium]|nr:MAG: hypothetical protein EHM18_06100 [Acidobacteriota bacterium]
MPRLGILDYAKEAFREPYNLILFIGALLAGIISLMPLVVWPLTAAVEILYLLTMANNARYQAIVRVRMQRRDQTDTLDVASRLIEGLSERRKLRFEAVRARCLDLQESIKPTGKRDEVGHLLESQQLQSVNQLLWVFLRTLAYEQALESFCSSMPRGEIQNMLRKTEAALQTEKLSDQMRTAYLENVDVLKKRLDNLERAETNLKTLEARLIRVENSIMLIQEQALTRQDPAFIEAEVNSATAGLTSVEQMLGSLDLPSMDAASQGPTPELLGRAEAER